MRHETKCNDDNQMIAEFIGCKYSNYGDGTKGVIFENPPEGYFPAYGVQGLKYHSSWDWLMEAVNKIEGISPDVDFNIKGHTCSIVYEAMDIDTTFLRESKIEATYKAVLSFIKWYNIENDEDNGKGNIHDRERG